MPVRMHDGQLVIDEELAGALIAREFPHLASLPVAAVSGAGTANAIFLVGTEIAARFPFARTDSAALASEAAAVAEFADASPFPAPRPLGLGAADARYPSAWALQTWLNGDVADPQTLAGSEVLADDLTALIGAPARGACR